MSIKFSISGNADDREGNPMPKLKMTGRQQWTPRARKYGRWKEYVVVSLIEHLQTLDPQIARQCARNYAACGKPLILGDRRATMDIVITWKDGHHGDPENIFGSIADALFHNDKYLSGSFTFRDEHGKGQVDVAITISEKRTWKQDHKSTRRTSSPRK